ncbi:hypothetical protein [Thermoproteus tenax]|uniref:Uncharacterized protein n=1 Tax=Thermoproteus tenax (strain ATCC 35583 / DSM 2078 / JCM 9277 / NBRC 100435 / Kra 1) TaxID=768679 RepID=G4RMX2_THETK|nr:hypothetical protein [Thermoproteus tenax]CCC80916.1 hypothetical protein TTX_0236 [Thermoproteus tenax Kra 1]
MNNKTEQKKLSLEPLVHVLSCLAREKYYGPLDRLARVEDNDEFYVTTAMEALYDALRYFGTLEGCARPEGLDEAVRAFAALVKRRPAVAKEVAFKALAKAVGGERQAVKGRASAAR